MYIISEREENDMRVKVTNLQKSYKDRDILKDISFVLTPKSWTKNISERI